MSKQAMQMALEALEDYKYAEARTALRAALAESEQEPVAWMLITPDGDEDDICYTEPDETLIDGWSYIPLYKAPPPRKPLSERELEDLLSEKFAAFHISTYNFKRIARGVEQAHGIGGSDE